MGRPDLWGPKQTTDRWVTKAVWKDALKWNKTAEREGQMQYVFCGSLMDFFEDHPTCNAIRPRAYELFNQTPFLYWQLLTKRPENIPAMLPPDWGSGYPNVWLGTSIEDRKRCNRATRLSEIHARIRFLSLEPLLEDIADALDLDDIHWIIVGGESGSGFRPMDHEWARRLLAKARERGVAFFFKQSAAIRTEMGTILDGCSYKEMPLTREPWIKTSLFNPA
jgi:protein gp37